MDKGRERMAAAAAAAQCRSPRCAAERRGFRRELDSWRHRLMHCVAAARRLRRSPFVWGLFARRGPRSFSFFFYPLYVLFLSKETF
ncbi:hypothetical protein FD754_020901 [Muntiacus muntjak]|uniref:Uncharacterized protein n=1 Tax=Muntiacus muntjak TaxID=9888 RepID=A0A5N3V4E2_MUNMU|nr:hypothetical protein FD754_020901 [Muntiacus muntjak]